MKTKIAIYLAGNIKKGHETKEAHYWTDEDMSFIQESLSDFEVSLLNPAIRTDDLTDNLSVFGRDMLQVFTSHFILVDARDRRGLGVGAEMMWAKVNRIPLITWAPKNSHYKKDKATLLNVTIDDFIHPFVEILSDQMIETLEEGTTWIRNFLLNPSQVKGLEHISSAMEHYKQTQLHQDRPMEELLQASSELKERMNRSHPKTVCQ